MDQFSYIANAEPSYVESLYREFQANPLSVDPEWKKFFEGFEFAVANFGGTTPESVSADEFKVYNLIQAYRCKAHLISDTNPIRQRLDREAGLSLEQLGFNEKDLDRHFSMGAEVGIGTASLREIIKKLKSVYSGSIGFEYEYVYKAEELAWLRERIEGKREEFSKEKKIRILKKLNETVVFEQFLNKKYIGQKRFSLEGGETTIPALDAIINRSAEQGVKEIAIGMAHRGRLNVLTNIMGKTYEQIFSEFEGIALPEQSHGDGDVKYHLGYSALLETPSGKEVHLKLTPNPSHLEAVSPVLEGFMRAKADLLYEQDYGKVLPIVIHGDAAVAGQGIAYEVVQMSQLEGYHTGGSIHFVINNQIGFTTDFDDARSGDYCTNVARIVDAPVMHVNGDDPEAVVFAVELAVDYRNKFAKDIFVDMVCYRKHGHNEGDDPKYTQPAMYKIIAKHLNPREKYIEELTTHGGVDAEIAEKMQKEFWDELQARLDKVKQEPLPYKYQEPERAWRKLKKWNSWQDFDKSPKTALPAGEISKLFKGLHTLPEELSPLPKVNKMLRQSQELFDSGQVDWAGAELLAYGSLLVDGHDVRMSGQDCKRGTFSHRHATIADTKVEREYIRLDDLAEDQGRFLIYNSLLSEFGVLGFEFGYSMASPNTLTVWEAQFGDFSNGAQTIIDQFITSSQSKWQRMSGLVMLLPHGYEGQGPEHSSARLERFLQACAEYNIVVANVTTPANFFHLIRRQLAWDFRKPLVVMSPKSLLRHPLCRSNVSELSEGGFLDLIWDDWCKEQNGGDGSKVRKALFCSGKIYYDLLARQREGNHTDVAIIRLEQLYPLALREITEVLELYPNAETCWVQEEPANMGAWNYILGRTYALDMISDMKWTLIARKSSASPATGFKKVHDQEQEDIVNRAFS